MEEIKFVELLTIHPYVNKKRWRKLATLGTQDTGHQQKKQHRKPKG